jgi:transcription termination factor NusB
LFRGVTADIALIDERITKHAELWKIQRMPAVARNILRIGPWRSMKRWSWRGSFQGRNRCTL